MAIEQWRRHYNEERPHMSLGDLTPAEYKVKIKDGWLTKGPEAPSFSNNRWSEETGQVSAATTSASTSPPVRCGQVWGARLAPPGRRHRQRDAGRPICSPSVA